MNKPRIHSSYLNRVYNVSQFAEVAEKAIIQAKKALRETEYDTIAFTGTSGAAMAYILSRELGIPLLCVRKPNDGSHFMNGSNGKLEGNLATKKYIIVDDFICGGNTVRNIIEEIRAGVKAAQCVGIVLYDYTRSFRTSYGTEKIPVFMHADPNDNWDQRRLQFPYPFDTL